jgi:Na+-translocating ferredoxin:NAD+ oxidoreductase RnfE subunit
MDDRRLYFREAGTIFWNGMLFRNPVLAGALGLYPVVAAGCGMRNATALSLLFLIIALPTQLLLCLAGMLLPRWARPAAVLLLSAVFYLPAARAVEWLFPGSLADLGMAAALMACNSIVYARASEYAPEHILLAAAADAAGCSVGFAGVICLVSAMREYWLTGGLWGTGVSGIGEGLDAPFAGFLLLGFLAALMRQVNIQRERRYAEVE